MKLVQEDPNQLQHAKTDQTQKQQKQDKSFIKPFEKFRNSISFSIQIHIVRFIFVSVIYYYSEVFLQNQKKSSEPWNSLLYFLAMMIEIIRFIGDCSLRNLLKGQQKKLYDIHDLKLKTQSGTQNTQNITLKGAKYEDYMYIFSLIKIFKYEHKNYSSAFQISKYMHFICTFLIFGWMSLTQQYNEETNWVQLVVLEVFLYSIYFTSFEIDLYLIQTSEGRYFSQQNYNVSPLLPNEVKIVIQNFKKWRKTYLIMQNIGTLFVLLGVLIYFKLSLLFLSAMTVVFINLVGLKFEWTISSSCKAALKTLKREEINTYSLLKKTTSQTKYLFKIFIICQRASILFLWFFFARDQSLSLLNFVLIGTFLFIQGVGILILIFSQAKKFSEGNKLKLMTILEDSYSHQMISQNQTKKQFECAICLKLFQRGQKVKFLPCSKEHIFHSSCFEDWKRIKTQCPLCRYPLSDYI